MKVLEDFVISRLSIIKREEDIYTTLAVCPYYSFSLPDKVNNTLLRRLKIIGKIPVEEKKILLPKDIKEICEVIDL